MVSYDNTATADVADNTLTELIAAPPAARSIVLTSLNFTNKTASNDYVDVYAGATVIFSQIPMIAGLGSGNVINGRGVLIPAGSSVSFKVATGGATIYANATYQLRNGSFT